MKLFPMNAHRCFLLAALLSFGLGATEARAQNILRRAGSSGPVNGGDPAAAAAAAAAAQAAAAVRESQSPLRQALDAIHQWQAAQNAARAASQTQGDVPNGLGVGGLQLSSTGLQIGADAPTQATGADGKTDVTIVQTDQRAIVTWQTFNVGQQTDVHFDQTAGGADVASWVLLNHVVDPLAAPSQILGSIHSEGQVYIVNRNGVIFGSSSQVNVGALVVSGLDFAYRNPEGVFLNGPLTTLAFAKGANVEVDAGAMLNAGPFGRVVLLGQQVINAGTISSPDGQVLLAAASSITLAPSTDLTGLRGLIIPSTIDGTFVGDGLVQNTGVLLAERGNISMLAGQVQQYGLASATTGALANGSILLGVDGFTTTLGGQSLTQILPDDSGTMAIGQTTFTPSNVQLHGDKITLLDGAAIYAPSGNVSLNATMVTDPTNSGVDDSRVYVGVGARIDVSGLLDVDVAMEQNSIAAELRANELRDDPILRNGPLRGSTIYFDARLGVNPLVADVSGYYGLIQYGIQQLMTAGGTVNLTGNQIILREGSTINLSGGSVQFQPGYVRSTQLIDPTGQLVPIEDAIPGVDYLGIAGDYVNLHSRWGTPSTFAAPLGGTQPVFEPGYVQGVAAGTLSLGTTSPTWYTQEVQSNPSGVPPPDPSATGTVRIFDGNIVATTVVGPKQQLTPTGTTDPTQIWQQAPQGATLRLTNAGDVSIANIGVELPEDFQPDGTVAPDLRYTNLLPARLFDGKTFNVVSISSGFDADVNNPNPGDPGSVNRAQGGHLDIGSSVTVDLGTGGVFSYSGKSAEIDGTLLAPGGSVSITALQKDGSADPGGVHLGATGVIDVAGRLSNDVHDSAGAPLLALNGGSVSLTSTSIELDSGALIDVSGGAQLNANGKSTVGNGGSIVLDVSRESLPAAGSLTPPQGQLVMAGGVLRGYAAGKGGSLSIITGYDIVIGDQLASGSGPVVQLGQAVDPNRGSVTRQIDTSFFSQGGFASYTIVGERSLQVLPGTTLAPTTQSLVLPAFLSAYPTGTRLDDFASLAVLPADQEHPMSLTLSTVPVRVLPQGSGQSQGYSQSLGIGAGASILLDPGSSVLLRSAGLLSVSGTIEAPGGSISLSAPSPAIQGASDSTGVVLTDSARLFVQGYQQQTRVSDGEDLLSIARGGSVTLTSASTVSIASGAVIDASGVAGTADLSAPGGTGPDQTTPRVVAGSAGSISISATSGLIGGDLRLGPGVAPDGSTGVGGAITIDKLGGTGGQLIVRQSAQGAATPAAGLTVIADSIDGAQAADLTLQAVSPSSVFSTEAIVFDGNVSLTTSRSLSLISPVLGTTLGSGYSTVALASPYVQLQGGIAAGAVQAGGDNQNAVLTVNASLIDIEKTVVLGCVANPNGCGMGGFGNAVFNSTGDLRLSDHDVNGNVSDNPGLYTIGALDLRAAQVYVESRDQSSAGGGSLTRAPDDPGFLVQSARSITVECSLAEGCANTQIPYSFGERLTLSAPTITQGGVLRAPEGQIDLTATGDDGTVTLLPGSITSVSAGGLLLPFGPVQSGGTFLGFDQANEVPVKSIKLNAPTVDVQRGASVDVSGGSDLLGYSFVPGNGGSNDILSTPGGFAIVPALGTAPAPVGGTADLRSASLVPGETIHLVGVPGIPDGNYTVLPAHYALLPGGYFIEPLGGAYADPLPAQTRPDGAVIASGDLSTSTAPGLSQFLVMSPAVFNAYSDFATYSLNAAAAALGTQAGITVRTPYDAGAVVLDASKSLTLLGTGHFGSGPGGLLGDLDISAPKIAVVSPGSSAPDSSYLVIDPQTLADFGAGSVLLGGTRDAVAASGSTPAGTEVTVNASAVYVATNATAPLTGQEILLAATGSVTVKDGSVISAQGTAPMDTNPLLLSGDGALLRISSGDRVPLDRTGADGLSGSLSIGAATITTTGSLSLDGTGTVALADAATLSAKQFDLASVRINLGDAPAGTPGVTLSEQKLDQLASASDLLLRGYDSIELYGDVSLGSRDGSGAATIKTLTLDTGLLEGVGSSDTTASITAADLTLQNSGGGAPASAGLGTLSIDADQLLLGPGAVTIAGFTKLSGTASAVVAQGQGGLSFAGDLALATGEITSQAAAQYDLSIGGNASITQGPAAPAGVANGLGGSFSIEASTLLLDTAVALPAGTFAASALSGSLQLGSHASVNVSGTEVDFPDRALFAPGGKIKLSATGDVSVDAAAALNVSGAARGGNAGELDVTAGGATSLLGSLNGAAAAGYLGGSFQLDTGEFGAQSSLTALNKLLQTGSFTALRSVRLRQGDLLLAAGDEIDAHEVILRADEGQVTVAGTIDASGDAAFASGGDIQLIGGNGVSLASTAVLDAAAASPAAGGFAPASGSVTLTALGGSADLTPGARIDLSGGSSGGGLLSVRAARDGDDVAIDRLGASITGARGVVLQGVEGYQASTLDATLAAQMIADAQAWLSASQSQILDRLGSTASGAPVSVGPGIQVTSTGDLTVASNLDLSLITGGAGTPGYLGLTAAGTLDIKAVISDGFASTARNAALLSGHSFSYGFEAGTDILLEASSMVRTGDGDISLKAGRDLNFLDVKTTTDIPAVVYTAGVQTATPGFGGAPTGVPLGAFPTEGGDIELTAGRDITAPLTTQTTSAWLARTGSTVWGGDDASSTVGQQTSWSVLFANFQQGVGALGGGDVRVRAGRDIRQLAVAIPSTGFLTSAPGTIASAGALTVRGGGDLTLDAGRDVLGGLFVLGLGEATLTAGGSVGTGDSRALRVAPGSSALGASQPVGILFGLMDATAEVSGTGSVYVEGIFDPMREGQPAAEAPGSNGASFTGYTARTAFTATSLTGDVRFENDPWAAADLSQLSRNPAFVVKMSGSGTDSVNTLFGDAPPTLNLFALQGDVVVEDHFGNNSSLVLAAAPLGTFNFEAGDNVRLAIGTIRLEDFGTDYIRGALDPYATAGDQAQFGGSADPTNNLWRGTTPLHAGDADPARIIALNGSVCAQRSGACTLDQLSLSTTIALGKPLEVLAGEDVVAGVFQPQNNSASDITLIQAGRDILEPALQIEGVGSALLQAGRDIVFNQYSAASRGGSLYSLGDTDLSGLNVNTALPTHQGTSLYLLAGAATGVNWQGFAAAVLDPQNSQHLAETYLPELATYLSTLGISAPSDAARVTAFDALPLEKREIFLDQVYFNELKQTGIDYNDPTSPRYQSYQRGFTAISLLFPQDPQTLQPGQGGNVQLNGKPVETQAGGDITILAPYGEVAVGADVLPRGVDPSAGGIVTRRGGSIRIMANGDIALFTSRVFTLEGGDITMWTSNGSITAGAGSQTSVFQKPLAYTLDPEGALGIDAFGLQTGAGIGVLDALLDAADRPRSRLDLIAPNGQVNAGDAGIRVIGDINIAAQTVVGVSNIQATGTSSGVPKVEAPNIGALTTASQATQATTNSSVAAESAPQNTVADLPSIITVEVLGYDAPAGDTDPKDRKKR